MDPNPALRELLGSLLSRGQGIECPRLFASTQLLLEALPNETAPQVILLDMPFREERARGVLYELRLLVPIAHVVMMRTFFDFDIQKEGMSRGAAGFVVKIDYKRIVETIHQVQTR